MAPRVEGEELALRRAYEAAGVDPATVGLIEAHGTGTPVGDASSSRRSTRVFGERDGELPPLRARLGEVDDRPHDAGRRHRRPDQGRARAAPQGAAADARTARSRTRARTRADAVLPQHRDAAVDPRRRRAAPRRRQRVRLRRHQRPRGARGVRRRARPRDHRAAVGQRGVHPRGATRRRRSPSRAQPGSPSLWTAGVEPSLDRPRAHARPRARRRARSRCAWRSWPSSSMEDLHGKLEQAVERLRDPGCRRIKDDLGHLLRGRAARLATARSCSCSPARARSTRTCWPSCACTSPRRARPSIGSTGLYADHPRGYCSSDWVFPRPRSPRTSASAPRTG